MTAPLGRVAELERTLAATVAQNGELRRKHAEELGRNTALVADLYSRDMRIAHLDVDNSQLRAENQRLSADLATARAVPTRVGGVL